MRYSLVIIAALLFSCIIPATAQKNTMGGGPYSQSIYNTATVTTLSGTVQKIEKISNGGKNYGIHIIVKAQSGTIPVHLGPQWYMDGKMDNIKEGIHVVVEGSKVMVDGKPAIIARSVKAGDHTIQLRDADGRPLWSRSKMRNQ